MGKPLDYQTACTNCGESNYHVESNISFITGVPGFHVCHSCGYYARQFPKMARQEILLIKEQFAKSPKHLFKNRQKDNSKMYFYILAALAIFFAAAYFFRA